MTGNSYFPPPVAELDAVSAALHDFRVAVGACGEGDRLKVAIKNQKREVLVTALHELANYVLFKSNGDVVAAQSSNFTIGKTPAPAPPIEKPGNQTLLNGSNPGQLVSQVGRVKGAICYLHQFATDAMMAQDNWQSVPSSKTSCIIADLQAGVKYNCRVAALGTKGQIMYSDIISRIAV